MKKGFHNIPKVTLVDRTAEFLREGIRNGRWKGRLPGQVRLANELGVSCKTLTAATARLVKEGVLAAPVGRRAPLLGKTPMKAPAGRSLRVGLFLMNPWHELPADARQYLGDWFMDLRKAGHHSVIHTFPSGRDQEKTGFLKRQIGEAGVDAWVVLGGTQGVLNWFLQCGVPTLALGGRSMDLPMAVVGSPMDAVVRKVTRRLLSLGHRRIVMIISKSYRNPEPGVTVSGFLEELKGVGIRPGKYHTPDWKETPSGLSELMDELFRVTPPTAILCLATNSVYGVHGWLLKHGFAVPDEVSLVSYYGEISHEWYSPGLRMAKLFDPLSGDWRRAVMRWLAGVAEGRADKKKQILEPFFDEGTSIGPAKTE